MKLLKNLKIYLTLSAIIIIGIILASNGFFAYGLVLIGISMFIFWIWNLFVKSKEEEITKLNSRLDEKEEQSKALKTENDELRNRKLNIAEIKRYLEQQSEIIVYYEKAVTEELDKSKEK